MRYYLLFLTLFSIYQSWGQKTSNSTRPLFANFRLDLAGNIYYEKVFNTDLSSDELEESILQAFGSTRFEMEHFAVNSNLCENQWLSLPNFALAGNYVFNVLIQIDENRYRVLATNFWWIDNNCPGENGQSTVNQLVSLEEEVYNRNLRIERPKITENGLQCFSRALDNHFDIALFRNLVNQEW